MNSMLTNPSSPLYQMNNQSIDTKDCDADAVTLDINNIFSDMSTFQEIIVSCAIIAVLTLTIIYVFEKINL